MDLNLEGKRAVVTIIGLGYVEANRKDASRARSGC